LVGNRETNVLPHLGEVSPYEGTPRVTKAIWSVLCHGP